MRISESEKSNDLYFLLQIENKIQSDEINDAI